MVIFSNTVDLKPPYFGVNVHSGCGLRKWVEDHAAVLGDSCRLSVQYFGVDHNTLTQEDREGIAVLAKHNVTVEIVENQGLPNNKPLAEVFRERMQSLQPCENEYLTVLFNLEVLTVGSADLASRVSGHESFDAQCNLAGRRSCGRDEDPR